MKILFQKNWIDIQLRHIKELTLSFSSPSSNWGASSTKGAFGEFPFMLKLSPDAISTDKVYINFIYVCMHIYWFMNQTEWWCLLPELDHESILDLNELVSYHSTIMVMHVLFDLFSLSAKSYNLWQLERLCRSNC
jgi:hypothetical protein